MKTQKIKITRKNGHYRVKGNGDRYLWLLAGGAINRGEMEPTFGYKLRRFFRRLTKTASAQIGKTITVAAIPGMASAADVPYIGLEDSIYG